MRLTEEKDNLIEVDLAEIRIRPVKVLWFVPLSKDLSIFKKINKFTSRLWGGACHCIIPQKEYQADSLWYSIIKNYDPDVIVFDDRITSKIIVPHDVTVFYSISYSKIQEFIDEGISSTFGLGMNLHKIVNLRTNTTYYLHQLKDYYWNIVLGDPPLSYEDFDLNSISQKWRFIDYVKDISRFFGKKIPILELKTISSYKKSLKFHESETDQSNKREMTYSSRNVTTIDLNMNFRHLPSKFNLIYLIGNLVVVGEYSNLETIVLYWNIRIGFKNTFLISKDKLLTHSTSLFPKNAKVTLLSIEFDLEQLKQLKDELANVNPLIDIGILTHDDLISIPYPEYHWSQYGNTIEPITIVNDQIKTSIRSVNGFIDMLYEINGKINFVTEFRFDSRKFPKRTCLWKDFKELRVTKSHNLAVLLSDEDTFNNLDNAYLTKSFNFDVSFPSPIMILEALCKSALKEKFRGVDLSNLGRYTSRFIQLSGSLDETIELLNKKYCIDIISAFLKRKEDIERMDTNQNLKKVDFTYHGIIKRVMKSLNIQNLDEDAFDAGLFDLIKKKIVIQGLYLQCQSCSSREWYNLQYISEDFVCLRCGFKNLLGLKPKWSYRLNQLVFDVLPKSTNTTIETLFALKSESNHTFDFIPEFHIRIQNNSQEIQYEIDLFAIQDGKIIIGETKSSLSGFNASDQRKYQEIILYLKPDIFLISAIKHKERNQYVESIEKLCSNEDIQFKLLELSGKFIF